MSPEGLARVRRVIEAVLARESEDRGELLSELCGDDDSLRAEALDLLRCEDRSESLLNPPDECAIAGMLADVGVVETIGAYQITGLIAHGGMGAVYLAIRADDAFEKQVAIKLIQGDVATDSMLRRFRQERQAQAQLDHPNVTRLLDGGTTDDGIPYIVMEHVNGRPIDRYCVDGRLTVRERLHLFIKVCDAVHYAHQNLVVHRDLKPSNILVTGEGEPKLLDFGIAKLLDPDSLSQRDAVTETTGRVMTPQYASPEQIRGAAISTASDVYSLGVVLYELLSGHRPYQVRDLPWHESERIVCETQPQRPSTAVKLVEEIELSDGGTQLLTPESVAARRKDVPSRLRRRLSGDLDNIVNKAMRKQARGRCTSAEQFADDIRRHLDGLPVMARRDTLGYRAGKFVNRNKVVVGAALVVVVAITVGVAGLSVGLLRAREQRNAAIVAKAEALEVVTYLQDLLSAANPYQRGHNVTVLELLEEATSRVNNELANQPEVKARVSLTIGQIYGSMWRWEEATPHLRTALRLHRELRGDDDLDVATCLKYLGRTLTFARDPESESLQRESLAIRKRHLGEEHALVAEGMGTLGYALWHGVNPPRWAEAEALYRGALAMYERMGLQATLFPARLSFSLGVMCRSMKWYEASETLFRDSLAVYRKLPAGDGRYMLECLRKYGELLQLLGRYDESRALFREALAMTPEGIARTAVIGMTWTLGQLAYTQNRYVEAEREYRDALRQECQLREAANPEASELLGDVHAMLEGDAGPDLSESHYVAIFRGFSRIANFPERAKLAKRMRDITNLLVDTQRYSEGEQLARTSLKYAKQLHPEGSCEVALGRDERSTGSSRCTKPRTTRPRWRSIQAC